jgi:hypothetical protein
MRWLAYRVPRKNKPDIFYIPYEPFTFLEAAGRSYIHEARKDDRFEVQLLAPKTEDVDEDFLKNQVKGGILDTVYRDEKFVNDTLMRLMTRYIGMLEYFWVKYVIPAASLTWGIYYGFTAGTSFDVLFGAYLFKGREFFVNKIRKEVKEYHERVKRGIEWSFKDLADVKQVEHRGLKRLKEIIENTEDKTEAYIKALHACEELGLPELREFYAMGAPIEEQTIQEPHLGFALQSKPKETSKREFTRRTYPKRDLIKDPGMDLFDYKVSAKCLYKIKTFRDLDIEVKRAARGIGAEEITIFTTPKGYDINAYEIGNPRAYEKILIKAGMHGREPAGPLAILQMMKSFEKEGRYTDKVLSNSQIIFIPCDDPEGFTMRAWMAVDMEGHEEHWPPQQRIVRYRDTNGVWGDRARSPRIMAIQDYIRKEIEKPTLGYDLHETIGKFADLVYKGAGILSIEDFHIPEKTRQRLESMYRRPEGRIARALSKIPFTIRKYLPFVGKEYAYHALKKIPAFEVGEVMMRHVRERGLKTYRGEYQKLLEQPTPGLAPQLLTFDEGRAVDGPLLFNLEIRVCTAWLHDEFETLAYTTETFQNPLDERVLEHVAFVEGGIEKKLGLGRYAG